MGMNKWLNVQGSVLFRSDALLETVQVQQEWLRTFTVKVVN